MEKTNKQIIENAAWYAVYTVGRAERRVKKQLEQAGYESYQPLQPLIRAWGNHQRKVMVPVVPGFIFVCLSEGEVPKVASMKGVSFLLKGEGEYVLASDKQLCVDELEAVIKGI